MALTEKGKIAIGYIQNFYPTGSFSAKDLSDACGEKIAATTLNSIVNNGFLTRLGGSPVKFEMVSDIDDLIADAINKDKKGITKEHLENAKAAKKDEFYTLYEDIEKEVSKYRRYFRDKVIYLPCDDPAEKKSQFWDYFVNHFDNFGLKKLIATHYDENGKAYKIWIDGDTTGDGYIDDSDAKQEDLNSNGDFRSEECTEILRESDIVITNPPFSMFREFIAWIMKENKDFLVIGNNNALSYQEIFKLIKEDKIWCGYTCNKTLNFRVGDGYKYDEKLTKKINDGFNYGKVTAITWFTTLPVHKREENLILTKKYNPIDYPKYDNYDAINVDKIADIPKDYYGVMGVPITILNHYNPNQFKIIALMASTTINDINFGYPKIPGRKMFARILVQRIVN